jgi:hypothetical protein
LFSPDVPTVRPYLLTNRYNLLEILASRLLEPVEAFTKYYRDLLELCPGRLALVAPPFRGELTDLVSSEDQTAFPVALEVRPEVLGPGTPATPDGVTAWAPVGLIPLALVEAIHFRTATELDEHRLREYDNVRHLNERYRVSPELFASGNGDAESLLSWLRSHGPVAGLEGAEGIHPDRLGGAITLMAATCPSVEPAVETLRRCLDTSAGRKGKRASAEWLVASITARHTRKPTVDETVLTAALRVFGSVDASQSWRAVEVLSEVQTDIEPRLGEADRKNLVEHFDRMRQILRSERPFERLRPHGPPAEKALLLALMRPDPARLAGWSPEETGADWSVTLAASALVGALKGRRRMPTEVRSVELDDILATREAFAWNTVAQSTLQLRAPDAIRLDASVIPDGRRLRIKAGPSTVGSWLIRDEARPTPDRLATWTEARDPATEDALIALCDELGWDDCTTTYIDTSGRPLELADPSGNTYSVSGRVTVRRGLNASALRSRLDSKETSSIDRTRVTAVLDDATQSPPDSQRYSN